ncbi:NADH dehydrogenase [ubiquinone] 1 beta subcomplex subunit 6 isoform X2 [Dipodomys merriami]|uniref:NADH dehydrogenase [ubiquinone] 1 beta subcomplex subunit 6 isoform X2 n=1 Tax=Dipodomys merriami TaxID=94247 RepID=UPI003850D5F7
MLKCQYEAKMGNATTTPTTTNNNYFRGVTDGLQLPEQGKSPIEHRYTLLHFPLHSHSSLPLSPNPITEEPGPALLRPSPFKSGGRGEWRAPAHAQTLPSWPAVGHPGATSQPRAVPKRPRKVAPRGAEGDRSVVPGCCCVLVALPPPRTPLPRNSMTGYTPDEKLRLQQLRELRRQWLKDQELSPREPVLPPQKGWPMEEFWKNFVRNGSIWRRMVYSTYHNTVFAVTRILIPAWIIHYYIKYHVSTRPYAIVEKKPRIFPGDRILETGEVIPPMKDFPDHHH